MTDAPSATPTAPSNDAGIEADPPPQRQDDPKAALAHYRARMRRQRTWYVAIVTAIVVAIGVAVTVAWSRGEAAHAFLHTVARAPAAVPLENPSAAQQVAWRTTDRLAIGTQPDGGTVITYGKRTVRGRDARTGTPTWSYTRTDRTVCTAAQVGGTTIAIYELNGNCDQVSAFASETGQRRWTRTLDIDGQPLNGHPSYQWTSNTLMITSPSVIYAIDPGSGLNRWTYSRVGCRIGAAVLGSAGALVSQTCVHPRCDNLKFCKSGMQLFLRDGMTGNGDNSKADRDQFKWNRIGDSDLPVSAGVVISALGRTTHRLTTLQAKNGAESAVSLSPLPGSSTIGPPAEAGDGQVMWIGGVTYSVAPGTSTQLWATPTSTAPTVVQTDDTVSSLTSARISAAANGEVVVLDGGDGAVTQRVAVPPPGGRGGLITPLGAGFLTSGATGVVAYR